MLSCIVPSTRQKYEDLCDAAAELEQRESQGEDAASVEGKHVHAVYEVIASHFSATRFAIWPKVTAFAA